MMSRYTTNITKTTLETMSTTDAIIYLVVHSYAPITAAKLVSEMRAFGRDVRISEVQAALSHGRATYKITKAGHRTYRALR